MLVVTVDPAVKALNNATFGKSYEKTITTRDVQPSVGFASRGSLLPGKIAEGLPVMALNVNHVDVNFFRVKPDRWRHLSASGSTVVLSLTGSPTIC